LKRLVPADTIRAREPLMPRNPFPSWGHLVSQALREGRKTVWALVLYFFAMVGLTAAIQIWIGRIS